MSVIVRKPYVGFASGVLFAFLGMLLINVDQAPGAATGIVLWMFRITGCFLIFVSLGSVVTAVYALRKNAEMKDVRGGR